MTRISFSVLALVMLGASVGCSGSNSNSKGSGGAAGSSSGGSAGSTSSGGAAGSTSSGGNGGSSSNADGCQKAGGVCECAGGGCQPGFVQASGALQFACPQGPPGSGMCSLSCCLPADAGATDAGATDSGP